MTYYEGRDRASPCKVADDVDIVIDGPADAGEVILGSLRGFGFRTLCGGPRERDGYSLCLTAMAHADTRAHEGIFELRSNF